MDGDGISLEELEEYHTVVTKTFRSEEEGFEFYNAYALEKGFSVRKADVKRLLETNMVFRRLFYCFKEGYRSQKNFDRPNPKRTPRALSRCRCDARLEIELNADSGEWFVKQFVDRHNHRLVKRDESAFLYSHRGLSDAQKADAIEYGIGGLRTHQIMEVMEKQHGGYDKVGFVSRDLYNFVAEYKKKRIEGSDATFLLNYMRAQKDRDADFYFRYSLDSEGHLTNIFWADAQSRLDYVAFGGIVVFDSTYRVNRYNLPFVPFIGINHHRSTTVFGCAVVSNETIASYVWLLETFLLAMRQNHPRSLITDGDNAMARAISVVMPNADHRLCSWHIEQNMICHLRNPKLSEFRKFIYHAMEIDEFERRWVDFKEKYGFTEKDAWFSRMYELREKWSAAYTRGGYFLGMQSNQRSESLNSGLHKHLDRKMSRGGYFLGMQSNQRSESLNSGLHKHLDRKMSLVDLIEHFEHCLSRIRRNEAELDAKASQTVPFTRLCDDPLLKSAPRIYTPVMFKKVKEQIVKLSEWEVAEVTQQDGLVRYAVCRKGSVQVRFDVRCVFAGSSLESVNCHCRKMECEEIPCTHIFSVLKDLGMGTIPRCCVSIRWTMQAKDAFDSERNANTHIWSEQMDRYRELRNMASVALFKASKSTEQSHRVMDFLKSVTDDASNNDGSTEARTFGPMPAYFSGSNQTSTSKVLDPKPIILKGAPCKKRPKPFHETLKRKKDT